MEVSNISINPRGFLVYTSLSSFTIIGVFAISEDYYSFMVSIN